MGEDIGATLSNWHKVVDRARLDSHLKGLKKIAYYLGRRANNDGTNVRPGVNRTAVECEVSPITVRRAFKLLQQFGLIELVKKGNSRAGKSNEYRLTYGPDVLESLGVPDPGVHAAAIEALGETDRKRNAKRWARLHPKESADDQPEPELSPLTMENGDNDPESELSPLTMENGDNGGSLSDTHAGSPELTSGGYHRSPMESGNRFITAQNDGYHRSSMGERSTPLTVNSPENSTPLFAADKVREELAATCAREAEEGPPNFAEEEKNRNGQAHPLAALFPSANKKPAPKKTRYRDDPVANAMAVQAAKVKAYAAQLAAQNSPGEAPAGETP